MTYHGVADLIERTTRTAIGVGVSPHMFRTAAASSAAVHANHTPIWEALFFITEISVSPKNITIAHQA
jgi:hypothetical protein